MKKHAWLNLALIVLVAALALFAYYKPQKKDQELRLSTLKPADAKTVKIEIAGTPPVELERSGADWLVTAPVKARADAIQAQRVLEILEATAKDSFPPQGLARYDLNEPPVKLTINQQSFAFGAVNDMSREQYVLTQGNVYPVSVRFGAMVPKSVYQVVSKQLFAPDEAPVAFKFDTFSVAQMDGKWQLAPAGGDLSADDFTRWADEWRLVSALGVLPQTNRKPVSTIEVTLKNGQKITVNVVTREPQLVLQRSDRPFEYQMSGEQGKRLLAPPSAPPAPAPQPAPQK